MWFLNIFFFVSFIGIINAYTITMNSVPALPFQVRSSDNSFLRYLSNGYQHEVICHRGTYLDYKNMKCVFSVAPEVHFDEFFDSDFTCIWYIHNIVPVEENCRYFLTCGPSGVYKMECPPPLLFNDETERCDWPQFAHCCEYPEFNSDVMITPVE